MTGDNELEIEVRAELNMIESSHAEQAAGLPVSEWLFDPVDAEREKIVLADLLGAAAALEAARAGGGDRRVGDDRGAG